MTAFNILALSIVLFFSEIYLCQKFVRITDSSFGNNCLWHILQSFARAFKSLQLMTVNSTNISWGPNQTIHLLSLLTQKSFYKCLQMILRTWLYRIIMWKIYRIRLNVHIWLKMAFVLHFCQLAKVGGSKGASWVSPSTVPYLGTVNLILLRPKGHRGFLIAPKTQRHLSLQEDNIAT